MKEMRSDVKRVTRYGDTEIVTTEEMISVSAPEITIQVSDKYLNQSE